MTRRTPPRAPTEDATVVRLVPVTGARRYDPDFDDEDGGDGGGFDIGALLPRLDDRSGPARRLAAARNNALIRSITDAAMASTLAAGTDVDAAAGVPVVGVRPDIGAPVRSADKPRAADHAMNDLAARREPRRTRRGPAWLVAAAVMLVVSAAAAAVYVSARAPEPVPTVTPLPDPPAPKRHHRAAVVAPPPAVEVEVVPIEELDAGEIEMLPTDEPQSRRRHRSAEPSVPEDATPEDLLALANQARKDKRWRDADVLYRKVMTEHASSSAAQVATVASADLHLDHLGDPAGRRFRRALRLQPAGALAEEARWGIAEAQRALEDDDAEVEALRAFLAAHPGSARAPKAKARLVELEPR